MSNLDCSVGLQPTYEDAEQSRPFPTLLEISILFVGTDNIRTLYYIVIRTFIYNIGNCDFINYAADSLVKLFPDKQRTAIFSSLAGIYIAVKARNRRKTALGKT